MQKNKRSTKIPNKPKTQPLDDILVFDDANIISTKERRAARKKKISDMVDKPHKTTKRRKRKKSDPVEHIILSPSDCNHINKNFIPKLQQKWDVLQCGEFSEASKISGYIRGAAHAAKVMGNDAEYTELRKLVVLANNKINEMNNNNM